MEGGGRRSENRKVLAFFVFAAEKASLTIPSDEGHAPRERRVRAETEAETATAARFRRRAAIGSGWGRKQKIYVFEFSSLRNYI